MKKRLLEILDELKEINNNSINIMKDNIINNVSVLTNQDIIEQNEKRTYRLKQEYERLIFNYEKELLFEKTMNEFKECINKIVNSIKEEDGDEDIKENNVS